MSHSRRPTSRRSGAVDPSLESCDPPLQEKSTLPSLGQPTVKGAALEVDQTLDISPYRSFIEGARPLARIGLGGANIFLEVISLLSPTTPTPFTSSNSFPSCSTQCLASQEGNSGNYPGKALSSRVSDSWPVLDSAEPAFF